MIVSLLPLSAHAATLTWDGGATVSGSDSDNWQAHLSDIGVLSFSAIPEPATTASVFGALVLAGVVWQRRRGAMRG